MKAKLNRRKQERKKGAKLITKKEVIKLANISKNSCYKHKKS